MPQPRTVVLNYDPTQAATPFGPTPRQVRVAPGDTIVFRVGAGTRASQPNCKLRITIHKAGRFSQQVLAHSPNQTGEEDLTVSVLPGSLPDLVAEAAVTNDILTGYKCELLDSAGSPLKVSDGSDGGEIVPDSVS